MKAVRAVGFRAFGGPEALELLELPLPVPDRGDILVRVSAATVNPTDLMMLTGRQAALMKELKPPFVAGMEFAGRVQQLGEDVSGLRVGDPVMGIVNPRRPEGGAHAQVIRVPAASVTPLPDSVDLVEAATVPMNGLTARMCLESLDLRPGGTLLVTGAAGAVGGYVIQLAKHAGLRILADAKESDRELLLALGADTLVPRGEGMAAAVRALHPGGVDGLVDAALLGDAAAALVRDGGAMVSLRSSQVVTDARIRHTHVGVLQQATNNVALRWLAERFEEGTLRPRIAARLPMERAAEAFALVQNGGLRGRVALLFDEIAA